MSFRADFERSEVERLYRAIADREPTHELLQLVHDMFGVRCGLRPPADEMRLSQTCNTGTRTYG